MLISKTTKMKWHISNREYYEDKGYQFTKFRGEFEVSVNDLPKCSTALVDVKCDRCNKILFNTIWQGYRSCVKDDGKYYCRGCSKNIDTRFITFEEWCRVNLSKEESEKLLLRWDYSKNEISPNDISFSSEGIRGKGYWFKCLDHPEHESEQRSISSFTHRHNGKIECTQCNMIATTNPHWIKYLVNKEDALRYSKGSVSKVAFRCPECGYEKEVTINNFGNNGFNCPRCSDGFSYSERFLFNLLEQLNTKFKTQLSKTDFNWCRGYKYDFYLNRINCIIETHGIQHYEGALGHWKKPLRKIQENDKRKEALAKINGVENYIILDCRKSDIEWMKNTIMSSMLPELLCFNENSIDWEICHERSFSSKVKVACDLWASGINNINEIAEKTKLHRATIWRYLKRGSQLGWCNYIPRIGANQS